MAVLRPARLVAPVLMSVVSVGLVFASSGAWVPAYEPVAILTRVVDGKAFGDYAFDAGTHRLYASSRVGLFWFDLNEKKPTAVGPLFEKDILRIELAPESGRLFYIADDEVGFVDIRQPQAAPVTLAKGHLGGADIVYEPTRQEVYLATRTSTVFVFSAVSGKRLPDVTVPGWYAAGFEAIPGRVFLNVAGKNGIYQIDAATHSVTPWAVDANVVAPARLEADPAGQTLFAAYDQYIVALDVRTAKEVGRIVTAPGAAMAFDPGTGWLTASWIEWQHPFVHLRTYSLDADGLMEIDVLKSRVSGEGRTPPLEPTSHGFIQMGSIENVLWKAPGG